MFSSCYSEEVYTILEIDNLTHIISNFGSLDVGSLIKPRLMTPILPAPYLFLFLLKGWKLVTIYLELSIRVTEI